MIFPLLSLVAAVIVIKALTEKKQQQLPPDVEIPEDKYIAPAYGDFVNFPDTSYLYNIDPMIWGQVDSITAILRDGDRYDIRNFIKPEQMQEYAFPDLPLEEAICKMFERVIQIPYINEDLIYWDYWRYPNETLQTGGDCEDTSFVLESMLLNRMAEAYMVAGYFIGDQLYGHAWVLVRLPGKGDFILESALDFYPDSYWVEAHYDEISQYYIPFIYWNLDEIYVDQGGYYNVLNDPQLYSYLEAMVLKTKMPPGKITHMLGAEMPGEHKREQIIDLWKRKKG